MLIPNPPVGWGGEWGGGVCVCVWWGVRVPSILYLVHIICTKPPSGMGGGVRVRVQ